MAEQENLTNAPQGKSLESEPRIEAPADAYGVEGCCVRQFWAVVETDGRLVRGRNVWRARRLRTGVYEVVFTGDVSNGVFTATIGRPGIYTEPAGMISVALRCCLSGQRENKGVWVDTHDPDGTRSDRAFHLMVHTQ
ncbi:MAG: hypothetical protein SX243_04160 [Acidobacteriota bacterium]|nr:hypothetical protein [Acidobacteriota bacterium]